MGDFHQDHDRDCYEHLFEKLKIPVEPLPEHYNPEDYGRQLMRAFEQGNGVRYSDHTTIYPQIVRS